MLEVSWYHITSLMSIWSDFRGETSMKRKIDQDPLTYNVLIHIYTSMSALRGKQVCIHVLRPEVLRKEMVLRAIALAFHIITLI